jgi:hypothetical protein
MTEENRGQFPKLGAERATDIKAVIRHAVIRALDKAGNHEGESLKIPLAAVEIVALELADEIGQMIDMFRQGGDE